MRSADVLVVGMGGRIQRTVRAAVAAAVHRDHVGVTGEVGDLTLPDPRVRDRPAVQEEERRLAVPVLLPEDAHAVALDVPGAIRVSRARLLLRGVGAGHLDVSLDPLTAGR